MFQRRPMRARKAARPSERADAGRETSGRRGERFDSAAVSRWLGAARRAGVNAATPPREHRGAFIVP